MPNHGNNESKFSAEQFFLRLYAGGQDIPDPRQPVSPYAAGTSRANGDDTIDLNSATPEQIFQFIVDAYDSNDVSATKLPWQAGAPCATGAPRKHLIIVGEDNRQINLNRALEETQGWIRNSPMFCEGDSIDTFRPRTVGEFRGVLSRYREKSLAGMCFLGHSDPGRLYLSMGNGWPYISDAELLRMAPLLAASPYFRFLSCNTQSLAKFVAQKLNAESWGNNASTAGVANFGGFYLPTAKTYSHYYPGGGAEPLRAWHDDELFQRYEDIP